MTTPPKKRGRKRKPYVCPWNGETIDGLYPCKDGRWRVVETGEKFTEADPRRAVAEFRRRHARRLGMNALIPLPILPPNTDAELAGAVEFLLRREHGAGHHHAPADETLALHVPVNGDPVALLRLIPEDVYYAYMANDIITRREYVAQRTGIEQIAYLTNLRKPQPSPTLDELETFSS